MRFELFDDARGTKGQTRSLKSLIKLIKEEVRETDIMGATNKNEIMIIFPYCDSSGAEIVNTRLSNLIRDFHFGTKGFKIDFGLVCFPVEATDMSEILKKLKSTSQPAPQAGLN
jgi:GGDEF domain-containing protein